MSLNLNSFYKFGSGNLNDVEIDSLTAVTNFNSYAKIIGIDGDKISIDTDTAFQGQFEKFDAGNTILIHCSASPTGQTAKLGKYLCAKILLTANSGTVLTLDKVVTNIFTDSDLDDYFLQAITFANFHCLTVHKNAIIAPQNFSPFTQIGGILAIKCSDTLTLDGGYIALNNCGIPLNWKESFRPLTDQEISGTLDSDSLAGDENYLTQERFLLNSGDGAVFIAAKNFVTDIDARIGNIFTHGNPDCRGADDSALKPSNVTNIGGSSIFIATGKNNLKAINLAKYRMKTNSNADVGKGLARCYISADNYPLRQDGKLYFLDTNANPARFSKKYNLYNFGSGKYGTVENPNYRLNSKAKLYFDMQNVIYAIPTISHALAKFSAGTKVWFEDNLFFIATLLKTEDNYYTFDKKIPFKCNNCFAIPEFENFTLTQDYDFEDFIIQVSNNCTIGGKISGNCIIFAKNLNLLPGAKLGDRCFLVADSVSGFDENYVPAEKFYPFVNNWQ